MHVEGDTVRDVFDLLVTHSNLRRCFMGDKSPKSRERQRKQDATQKNQKKAAAFAKAHPTPPNPLKTGK